MIMSMVMMTDDYTLSEQLINLNRLNNNNNKRNECLIKKIIHLYSTHETLSYLLMRFEKWVYNLNFLFINCQINRFLITSFFLITIICCFTILIFLM